MHTVSKCAAAVIPPEEVGEKKGGGGETVAIITINNLFYGHHRSREGSRTFQELVQRMIGVTHDQHGRAPAPGAVIIQQSLGDFQPHISLP